MRIHTYVIATDAGAAPNYDAPFVTLAVCKPRIRKKAAIGDCVIAYAGRNVNSGDPHAVVWAGIVAESMPFADYWRDQRFAVKKPNRSPTPDNFYRPTADGLAHVANSVHGPDSQRTDTSGINVLIFRPAWRFGAYGPRMPSEFGLRMIGGRRGERVFDLSDDAFKRLKKWLDAQAELETVPSTKPAACEPRKARNKRKAC